MLQPPSSVIFSATIMKILPQIIGGYFFVISIMCDKNYPAPDSQ